MKLNTTFNYSPNFYKNKRKFKNIKFIIFHYTGMKKEKNAINRLINKNSNVSCHYFIKNNGEILNLVPDLYTSWHAGNSSWKNYKSLNKSSIGIEINNPGHNYGYKKYSKKQIYSLIKLSKYLIRKYNIKSKFVLGHSDIAPLRKKDPGEKFPWKELSKKKISIWHDLEQKILLMHRKKKINTKDQINFFNNLIKIGYLKNLKEFKKKNFKLLVKAFQRRFRQEIINGIIDQECLLISKNLIKKFK